MGLMWLSIGVVAGLSSWILYTLNKNCAIDWKAFMTECEKIPNHLPKHCSCDGKEAENFVDGYITCLHGAGCRASDMVRKNNLVQ